MAEQPGRTEFFMKRLENKMRGEEIPAIPELVERMKTMMTSDFEREIERLAIEAKQQEKTGTEKEGDWNKIEAMLISIARALRDAYKERSVPKYENRFIFLKEEFEKVTGKELPVNFSQE